MNFNIKCGEYQHFKGNSYVVYGTAMLDGEEYVMYQHDYGTRDFWIRPLAMFTEVIERDGKKMQRFALVREVSADECFAKLREICSGCDLEFSHSETLEKFVISGIDDFTGKVHLQKKTV